MQDDHAFFISRELEINRSFGVTESNFAISTISSALNWVLPLIRCERAERDNPNAVASELCVIFLSASSTRILCAVPLEFRIFKLSMFRNLEQSKDKINFGVS